jgi:hypothetical protein
LDGKIVPCPLNLFKKVVETTKPIFHAKQDTSCVVIPPMARWLFTCCCNDPGYCTNTGTENF